MTTETAPSLPPAASAEAKRVVPPEPESQLNLLDRLIDRFWRVFSSVWLAVTLMVTIAGMSIVGHSVGIKEAEYAFFRQWFFTAPLALLMLNITVCTLSRYPWRLSQAPYLIVHVGLLTILSSFIITEKFALRHGQLILREGSSSDSIIRTRSKILKLDIETLNVDPAAHAADPHGASGGFQVKDRESKVVATTRGIFTAAEDLGERHDLGDGLELVVEKFYPNFSVREEILNDSKNPNPAVHVDFELPFAKQDAWLMALDEKRWAWSLGNVVIAYHLVRSQDDVELTVDPEPFEIDYDYPGDGKIGTLHLSVPGSGEPMTVALDEVGAELQIAGFNVKVSKFLPSLVVTPQGYQSRGEEPNNPAVEVSVTTPKGRSYRQVVFGKPEVKQFNAHAKPGLQLEDHSINFVTVWGKGHFLVKKRPGEAPEAEPIAVGGTVTLDRGPQIKVSFLEYVPNARVDEVVESTNNDDFNDAILVSLFKDKKRGDTKWIALGIESHGQGPVPLMAGDKQVHVTYTYERYPLGFRVGLDDFRVHYYEGTRKPSEFESFVWVEDPTIGERFDAHIFMNNTLNHAGFKFYQSSYQQPPQGPEVSIFSVTWDPGGIPFYVGFGILCLGVSTIFWLKPTLQKIEGKRNRQRAAAARAAAGGEPVAEAAAPDGAVTGTDEA